ncbi:MAG: hypothetical protein EHM35_01070 [Planctomycetaceae bacterium]|nr:MAG: hypothetical protein EHM35_01070 [Planctomycetaceae bacterium]
MNVLPCRVLLEMACGMLEGACKYGSHNYRAAGVRASIYYSAALGHLMAFWEGEDIDPDSGLPHIVKAADCIVVLRDSQIAGNWIDDRPPRVPGGSGKPELNKVVEALLKRYPRPVAPFTHDPEVRKMFEAAAEAQVRTCCQCARFNGGLGGPTGCNHVDPNTDASTLSCFSPMTPAEAQPVDPKTCNTCGKTCPVDDGYVRDMPCTSWIPQKMATVAEPAGIDACTTCPEYPHKCNGNALPGTCVREK